MPEDTEDQTPESNDVGKGSYEDETTHSEDYGNDTEGSDEE